jgi:hypothetical protein
MGGLVSSVAQKLNLKSDRGFPVWITSVFFLLELNNLIHHALWRDELQTWMIARSSHSIRELLYLKRFEGHPDFWFLVLYFLTRFTSNPLAMQMIHLAIASCTVYVFAKFAPFTNLQKALFAFGYFPFFEYATISRNYALGVLLVVVFCAVYRARPKKNYLLLSLLLSILAQSSIYGVILVGALSVIILGDIFWSASSQESLPGVSRLLLSVFLLVTSVCFSIASSWTPPDGGLHFARTRLVYTLTMISRSFVPIPRVTQNFWNSNILHTPEMVVLSIVLLLISILLLLPNPAVLAGYCSGIACLYCFKYFVHSGAVRYDGHAFLLFIACTWIGSYNPGTQTGRQTIFSGLTPLERIQAHKQTAMTGLLGIQAVAGIVASILAFITPFSRAKDVAKFITDNHMEKMFIVGDRDYSISTVAGYLDRDIFYLRGNRPGTFIIWDNQRIAPPAQTAIELARDKADQQKHDVLAILNYPSDSDDGNISKLSSFEGAVQVDENYYLYIVKYVEAAQSNTVPSSYPNH